MSLSNYSDLTTALQSWTARSVYTSTDLENFTALFEAWANRKLRTRQMQTTTSVTMSGGSGTLPTDYLQWRRVTWEGSTPLELQYVHPTILRGHYPTVNSFTPSLFTIEDGTLKTQSSDTTGITLLYFQKIPSLSTNSTNWLMSAHPDLYLSGTMLELCIFDKDPDNAVIWKARRDEMAQEIKELDKSSIGPGSIRVFGHTP